MTTSTSSAHRRVPIGPPPGRPKVAIVGMGRTGLAARAALSEAFELVGTFDPAKPDARPERLEAGSLDELIEAIPDIWVLALPVTRQDEVLDRIIARGDRRPKVLILAADGAADALSMVRRSIIEQEAPIRFLDAHPVLRRMPAKLFAWAGEIGPWTQVDVRCEQPLPDQPYGRSPVELVSELLAVVYGAASELMLHSVKEATIRANASGGSTLEASVRLQSAALQTYEPPLTEDDFIIMELRTAYADRPRGCFEISLLGLQGIVTATYPDQPKVALWRPDREPSDVPLIKEGPAWASIFGDAHALLAALHGQRAFDEHIPHTLDRERGIALTLGAIEVAARCADPSAAITL